MEGSMSQEMPLDIESISQLTVSREQVQEILTAADRKRGPQSYSHMELNPPNNVNEPGCHLFPGSPDKRSGWLSP